MSMYTSMSTPSTLRGSALRVVVWSSGYRARRSKHGTKALRRENPLLAANASYIAFVLFHTRSKPACVLQRVSHKILFLCVDCEIRT